jgi:hypothetical protein
MHMKLIVGATMLFGLLPIGSAGAQEVAADEQEFQQLVAALKANDAERLSAIAVCIEQGIGVSLKGLAKLMGVPVEQATEAWCTRMTNGIANGQLSLADVSGLNEGTISPAAQAVLTTVSEGK